MEPSANIAKIKAIKYLCCVKIRWQTYKNPRKITQCYRCQGMGHGSSNCYAKPKCVKCAGDHITKDCTKSPQDTPKCASCAGPHTANATICTFYKLQLQKIETNRARNSEKRQTKNSTSPAGHPTNRTLQHQRRNEHFPALPARPTQSPAPTAPTASSRHIPDRRQQQQQEEQPNTTRNEGNKTNYATITKNPNDNEEFQLFQNIIEEFRILNSLCDLKTMFKIIKNLNKKLKNCKDQVSRCNAFYTCILKPYDGEDP